MENGAMLKEVAKSKSGDKNSPSAYYIGIKSHVIQP